MKAFTPLSTTVRIDQLCEKCQTRKTKLDGTLSGVKSKMNDLKEQLSGAYGDCVKHVLESGLETQGDDNKQEEEDLCKLDPEEFIRRKRAEKDAHLMMLGSSSRK
ncbi:hypothetical protein NPX13_g5968 [Xylaria arbuscula]|uniref:Uncharacterized protein n=1 Tax=Xylaria arbuscula TaxID=114810 RepID=A0A9W8TM71_9PEZI|nr:hypothetical protein NPX13_g5968 [Xylaria arbuscula]